MQAYPRIASPCQRHASQLIPPSSPEPHRRNIKRIGIGVTNQAQSIFNAIVKTYVICALERPLRQGIGGL